MLLDLRHALKRLAEAQRETVRERLRQDDQQAGGARSERRMREIEAMDASGRMATMEKRLGVWMATLAWTCAQCDCAARTQMGQAASESWG